jgi:dihydroorotase
MDKASFEKGLAFSEGVDYVIVNGKLLLKNGQILTNTFPGLPIYGKFKK